MRQTPRSTDKVACPADTGCARARHRAVLRVRGTGQLGDVMQESISIAHSFARRYVHKVDPTNGVLSDDLHIHVPEGATPKDGPSAGITMVRSLAHACMRLCVRVARTHSAWAVLIEPLPARLLACPGGVGAAVVGSIDSSRCAR